MPDYRCKECGKNFTDEDLDELVEKAHAHIHTDHGKHLTERKIRRQIKQEE